MTNAPRPIADPQPYLLTDTEHRAIEDAGKLWGLLCSVVGDGPTRDADLAELIQPIHLIQRYVMGQAAVRAYPEHFRALGEVIPR